MLWLFDYSDSTSAAQTDTDIPLKTDTSVPSTNSHPLLPIPMWVQWVCGVGLTMTRLRISTPRVKAIARPVIQPVNQAATMADPLPICEYWRHNIQLNPVEEVQMLRTNTTAVAEVDHALLCVGDNQRNVQQGDLYTARGTTSFTPTINAWSAGVITMDDTLQVGRYQIIGMRVNDATGIGARLVFPGTPLAGATLTNFRPGVPCRKNNGQSDWYPSRFGHIGPYGEFESFALPQLEIMDAGPTANPEVFFDIVVQRVGARAA
jgi:hypothetical protein